MHSIKGQKFIERSANNNNLITGGRTWQNILSKIVKWIKCCLGSYLQDQFQKFIMSPQINIQQIIGKLMIHLGSFSVLSTLLIIKRVMKGMNSFYSIHLKQLSEEASQRLKRIFFPDWKGKCFLSSKYFWSTRNGWRCFTKVSQKHWTCVIGDIQLVTEITTVTYYKSSWDYIQKSILGAITLDQCNRQCFRAESRSLY